MVVSDRPLERDESEGAGKMTPDEWGEEWVRLLGMSTALLTAGDDLTAAMRGDLGPGVTTRDQAAPIIAQRIDAWQAARRDLIQYARDLQGAYA